MSIYSGFPTRQQQETYDQYLETVLYIFQRRLLKFYKNQSADEQKFLSILSRLHSQMKSMQNHKYLQPKSSNTFQQFVIYLKNRQANLNNQNRQKTHTLNKQSNLTQQIQKITNEQNAQKNPQYVQSVSIVQSQKQKRKQSSQNSDKINRDLKNFQSQQQNKDKKQKLKEMLMQSRPITTQNQSRIRKISSKSSHSNAAHQKQLLSMLQGNFRTQNQKIAIKKFQVQKYEQEQPPNLETDQLNQKLYQFGKPFQHILNPSASRFIKASNNQKRDNFTKSQNVIKPKKSSNKLRQKQFQSIQKIYCRQQHPKKQSQQQTINPKQHHQYNPNTLEHPTAPPATKNKININHLFQQNQNTKTKAKDNENYNGKLIGQSEEDNVRNLIKGYISKTRRSYMRSFHKYRSQIDQMLRLI